MTAVVRAIVILAILVAAVSFARGDTIPDPELTPGVATELTEADVCSTRWGRDARHVTPVMKREVFKRYGLTGNDDPACKPDKHGRRCEIDHLISRELGGADVLENLWPQPYGTRPWNAVLKDRLENRLHREVCAGRIPLETAQHVIAKDWRAVYVIIFGHPTEKRP